MLECNVGLSDSKEKFQEYLDGTECAFPGVYRLEGGTAISTAVGNGGVSGPSYLISPDKTSKKSSQYYLEQLLGDVPHQCGVSISEQKVLVEKSTLFTITAATTQELSISSEKAGTYTLSLLSLQGAVVVEQKDVVLNSHVHTVNLGESMLSPGMYVLQVRNSTINFTQKLIIK